MAQQEVKSKLAVDELLEFDGTYQGKVTTTVDLSRSFNGFFRPVLSDYEGNCITVINGQLYLELYFRDKGVASGGQVKCIQAINKPIENKSDLMSRVSALSKANTSNQKLELTDKAKELLEEFMLKSNNGKVNWKENVYETIDKNFGNQSIITLCIRGLDIYKILRTIYGVKDPSNDHRYQYQLEVNRPINQMDYVITISRFDSTLIEELCIKLNMTPATGSTLIMTRD